MRIATWNVNSVRARLPNVLEWLNASKPDVLLMQEIKCETDAFPYMDFKAAGYEIRALGQKSYNGVAIASLHPINDVLENLPDNQSDPQARYLEATIQNVRIANLYLPNGNPLGTEKYTYKLEWMQKLKSRAASLLETEQRVLLGGDFNVIPCEIDVHNPEGWDKDALYALPTRTAFREIINAGYTEVFRSLHPNEKAFSFWDYQGGSWQQDKGLRIDFFLASPEAMDSIKSCTIDKEQRGKEKASDHTPVVLDML